MMHSWNRHCTISYFNLY